MGTKADAGACCPLWRLTETRRPPELTRAAATTFWVTGQGHEGSRLGVRSAQEPSGKGDLHFFLVFPEEREIKN